jgi:predicted kinase
MKVLIKSSSNVLKEHKKKLYILVGPPAVGKSTWIEQNINKSNAYIISRDKIYEDVRDQFGGINKNALIEIDRRLKERFEGAKDSKKDIIIDAPNLTANQRRLIIKKLQLTENQYEKIAVVFNFKGQENIILENAEKRERETGKNISPRILKQFMLKFEDVQQQEGFNKIINVDNISSIKANLKNV